MNPPNVGLLQGWRVIDSVPSDCNHMAGPLVTLHDEQLLLGARPGKGDLLVAGDDLVQLLLCPVGHHVARDAGSSHLRVGGQGGVLIVDHWLVGDDSNLEVADEKISESVGVRGTNLLGDCLRCDWMVASHHDHLLVQLSREISAQHRTDLDTGTPALSHGIGDGGLGRVDHGHQADEAEAVQGEVGLVPVSGEVEAVREL